MLEVRGGGDDGMDAAAGKMTGRWVYEYRNEPVYTMGAYGIMEGRSHAVGQLCYEPYPSTIADLRKILEVCVHVLHSGWPCLRCDLTVCVVWCGVCIGVDGFRCRIWGCRIWGWRIWGWRDFYGPHWEHLREHSRREPLPDPLPSWRRGLILLSPLSGSKFIRCRCRCHAWLGRGWGWPMMGRR